MTISNDFATTTAPMKSSPQPTTVSNGVETPPNSRPKKLHGRAFYESIGSPRFVLAPMVDQSEFAWRMLTRSFMAPNSSKDLLAYTPMMHARLFQEKPKFRENHFNPVREQLVTHPPFPLPEDTNPFLDGNPAMDRPLFVQFCANNPDEFLDAARYVAPFCDAVDLNLGCPQGIARKGKYGAFLQEDQELIFSMINKIHKELDVPVTAKLRILETKEKTLAYAQNVLKAGASIITVHGRTRDMKGHKTGMADWSMIRFLRESLPKDTVIFANGNILNRAAIDDCLSATGADGVMSAEGNLYDPAIFAEAPAIGSEGREYWRGRDGKGGWRMDAVFRRYMDILYTYVLEVSPPARKPLHLPSDPEATAPPPSEGEEEEEGPARKKQKTGKQTKKEKTQNPNLCAMQPHLFHLLRSLVARHHHVRDALARCKAGDIAAFENVLQLVEGVVRDGLREYESTDGKSWGEELRRDSRLKEAKEKAEKEAQRTGEEKGKVEMDESSVETVRRCTRPWWVVQPYVRPLPKEALAKGAIHLSKRELAALDKGKEQGKVPEGHVEVEKASEKGGRMEEVEVPKEGLVCE